MLMTYGNIHCGEDWIVDEKSAVGYCRVYFVHGGDVEYQKGNIKKKLKKDFLYIFPSANAYSIKQNLNNRLYCTYLHLDLYNLFIKNLIEISIKDDQNLKYLLLGIKGNIIANNIEILRILIEAFVEYLKKYEYIKYPDKSVGKVFEYVSKNIEKNISVRTLSKIVGYNEQYFIRLFKKNTGITPYQYVITYRFTEAIKYLRNNKSASEIAYLLGFKDVKSFSRAFKNKFGVSPTKYKKRNIDNP